MLGTSGMLHLVKKLLMETIIVATKWNQVLFSGPFCQTPCLGYFRAYEWSSQLMCVTTHFVINIPLFRQWTMEGLWNRAHHSYAVVWLAVCSSNANLRILKLSMAVFPSLTTVKHVLYDISLFTVWLVCIWSELWNIISLLPLEKGAHKFSRNLGATSKF